MRSRLANILLAALVAISVFTTAEAQIPDPQETLETIIGAFQKGGPPVAYQTLSPLVFNLVASQTSGSGYYPQIAAAGPISSTEVLDSKAFPLGPMYVIRVTHAGSAFASGGPVDWFIGFNQATGKIEYLTFQTVADGSPPTIEKGATASQTIGGIDPVKKLPKPAPTDETPQEKALRLACANFPVMCK